MELSEQETRFLAKRESLVAMWGYVGVALLVGLAGAGGLIFLRAPLLANPFIVLNRLNRDAISVSTMALSTAILPIMFLAFFLLALMIALVTFAAFANERKYLSIIRKITGASMPAQFRPEREKKRPSISLGKNGQHDL